MIPLLFLDTETTGLRPDLHTPWEIAWQIGYSEGGHLRLAGKLQAELLVRLTGLERDYADDVALQVGRFDERYVEDQVWAPVDVLDRLNTDIASALHYSGGMMKSLHLVGAVPSFDHAMIAQNWTGWPGFGEGLWHYHLVDVEAVMAGRLGMQPPWNSHELSKQLGVEHDRSKMHTAMGDVQWAIDCYAAAYGLDVIGRTW